MARVVYRDGYRVSLDGVIEQLKYAALGILIIAVPLFAGYVMMPVTGTQSIDNRIQPSKTISVDSVPVRVEVADTPDARQQGLSGHIGLNEGEGLLFVFEQDGLHSFWMRDMLFSIDILWISSDGRVVFIEKSASPESFPASFTPPTPARYVLEVASGFSEAHDIEAGRSTVTF